MTSKILCTFLLLLFSTVILKADYSRMQLGGVIEASDIAVVGKIIGLDKECYTVEIEKQLYGDYVEKTISVVKFKNWQDHHRFKKYEIGQREIVFTRKSNGMNYPFEYESIGAGNEGEIEIIGDSAIILDRIGRESKYELTELCNAVIDYQANFSKIDEFYEKELEKYYEPFDEKILVHAIFTNDYISEFESKSSVHKLLITYKRKQFESNIKYNSKYGCKRLMYKTDLFRELFKGIDNRIDIEVIGYDIGNVSILSDECETFRKGNDFFVKPLKGDKTNLYFTYNFNNKTDTIRHFDFRISEPRQQTVDIEIFERLKRHKDYPGGYLSVSYGEFSDWSRFYRILSFSLDIISKEQTVVLHSVSARITREMIEKIRNSSTDDKFRVYDIKAFDKQGNILDIEPVNFTIDE